MSQTDEPTDPSSARAASELRWVILGLIAVAAILRYVAAQKSFWLDELHSTELARLSLSGMLALLRPDFHAPLFFTSAELLAQTGLSGHQLRLLPALGSLLMIWPFFGLIRSSGAAAWSVAAGLAVLLLAPFQIRYGVELRPYACLGLLCLVATWALFDRKMSARRRFLLFAGAATLGLYTHYMMAVFIIAAGAARLLSPGGGRLPIWKVIAAGCLGVALFMPWILGVESWLLSEPDVLLRDERELEAPEQDPELAAAAHPGRQFSHHRQDLLALPGRTFAPGAASLGGVGRILVLVGLGSLVVLVLGGLLQTIRQRERRLGLEVWGPIILAVIATLITTILSVKIWERLGIQYYATSAWAWAFLAVLAVQGFRAGAPRRAAALVMILAVSLAGLGEAIGQPREDLVSATSFAVLRAEQESAHLTAVLRQPGHYSSIEVYRVYAPHVAALEPEDVPRDERPVVVLVRSTDLLAEDLPEALVGAIRAGREPIERRDFGGGISVYVMAKKL